MKHLLIAFVALTLFVLPACKKDTDADSSSFSCKIDGTDYKINGLTAYAVNFDTYFVVYGVEGDGNGRTVYLSFPAGTKAGTYTLNADFTGYYVDAANATFANIWGQGGGSVTISEIDATHVKGTFEFNAYDSDTEQVKKAITAGKFDVAFR